MKSVDRARMGHHLQRAQSFLSAMQLLADDLDSYAAPACLLAVHGSISLVDAVLIGHLGKRSNDKDHRTATKPLRSLCHTMKVTDDGVKHFIWLVARKTDFAYGDRPITQDEVKLATTTARRFQAWIYKTFPEIVRETDPGD